MKQILTLAVGLSLFPLWTGARDVCDAARSLPVISESDVVVVGGSSGGVAAAIEAAKNGAKVYLVAPRPYLGEDLSGPYRLWLEPNETPASDLAKEVFKRAPAKASLKGIAFTYVASKPTSSKHKDTQPPSVLNDGKADNVVTESVEYDGDVSFQLDLGKEQAVDTVSLLAYQRSEAFEVEKVIVSASEDREHWKELAVIKNEKLGQGNFEESALALSAPVAAKTRYLKLDVHKSAASARILLGEIVVEAAGEKPATSAASGTPLLVTPMQAKLALDQALLKAKIEFLYSCFATDLLVDAAGLPAGVVIANRSGRQAVLAKVIIDATERGTVTRMTKATFTPYPAGTQAFRRVVLGGEPCKGDNIELSPLKNLVVSSGAKGKKDYPIHEYQLHVPMKDGSYASFAIAEQLARDWTWSNQEVDAADMLFQVPPDSFHAKQPQSGAWPGVEKVSLEAFQPAGVERIFSLNGCADLSREAAAELLRPLNFMDVGTRIGKAAAELAKSQPKLENVRLPGSPVTDVPKGDLRGVSMDVSPRSLAARTIPSESHPVPVLGEYDVVVVGGGTGGAPAAIGAGRQGARTLLIEYLHNLGGVGTTGMISVYYYGNLVGFTHEIDKGVEAMGPKDPRLKGQSWNADWKSEWYRRELRKANVEIWYGSLGTGALVEDGRVKGVYVATPQGSGVVMAKMVIDSTGNADIAAAAGASCVYTDNSEFAVQGTGLPPRNLGALYTNTDYTFVDETDITDIWRCFVTSREKFKSAYDLGQLIDTRERRRIVGDITLTPMDMMLGRTFPDTVVLAKSNFDSHGYTIHSIFLMRPPDKKAYYMRMPFRCLLPRGLDGIVVTGLAVSSQRDALPIIRMQGDIQNQGYAVGIASAMIARQGCPTRQLDMKALQKQLIQIGNLPESVLTETDSFPLPQSKIADAVAKLANNYEGLEVVLTQPEVAKPLLQAALAKAGSAETKQLYAHVLAMMGDAAGVDLLMKAVNAASWDKGWNYKGMGQFGASLSPLDSLIVALGRSGDPRALEPIIAKVNQLDASSEFSHLRAVGLALEALGKPAAAKPLAELLQKPGLSGHAIVDITSALQGTTASGTDNVTRNKELSELVLARALYRCGDYQGVAEKILKTYAQDLHAHYARHAQAVLKEKPGTAKPVSQ